MVHYSRLADALLMLAPGYADELNRASERERYMLASILAGEPGALLFGKPVTFTAEWPEGLPHGMTADQLRTLGQTLLDHLRGPGLRPPDLTGQLPRYIPVHGTETRLPPPAADLTAVEFITGFRFYDTAGGELAHIEAAMRTPPGAASVAPYVSWRQMTTPE